MTRRAIILTVGGLAVAALAAGAAFAQAAGPADHGHTQNTPFNYEIVDGKRVPKPTSRITNPDGSWREETRQGNCVVIKEGGADGSVKTTRKCG